MNTLWTSHLTDEEEIKQFKEHLKLSKPLFDRLHQLLLNELNGLEQKARDYDNPSWAYLQADINGQKYILDKVLKLTNIK